MRAFITEGNPERIATHGATFTVRGLTGEEWISTVDRYKRGEISDTGMLLEAVRIGLLAVEGAPAELDTLDKQRAALAGPVVLELGERIIRLSELSAAESGNSLSRSRSGAPGCGAAVAASTAPKRAKV